VIKKLFLNFINSINGIKEALKEHSFIYELVGGLFLIPYIYFSDIDNLFKIIILSIYFLLLSFELLNTAIEKLSDKISKDFDSDIKKIKDLSSASVFLILIILVSLIILSFFL
tara:strand:- start:66 stop:404 length:339 start_codon:yes stop_codon:yes gene_type:complete